MGGWRAQTDRVRQVTVMPKLDIARAVREVGEQLGISPKGVKIAYATISVECGWLIYANAKDPDTLKFPHDRVGSDGLSSGPFQQQPPWWGGYDYDGARRRMDVRESARMFFTALAKLPYNTTAKTPGGWAQAVQRSDFPDRYDTKWAEAEQLYAQVGGTPPVADPNRPDYNEYWVETDNQQDRDGTKIDLFLLHTNESDNNADQLARWMQGDVGVSYHYAISEDYDDHGVTVCDVVDTDEASWSVLSANNRSINLCFAGSRAAWTREQWLKQSRAIDVAAYIAVQDCRKYGIPTYVMPPPYPAARAGISDHAYVSKVLKDGDHTDVGPNFPWDVFKAAVDKYAKGAPAPQPAPVKRFPQDYSDRELLEYIAAQLGPGDPSWPSNGMTLRDKVWGKS